MLAKKKDILESSEAVEVSEGIEAVEELTEVTEPEEATEAQETVDEVEVLINEDSPVSVNEGDGVPEEEVYADNSGPVSPPKKRAPRKSRTSRAPVAEEEDTTARDAQIRLRGAAKSLTILSGTVDRMEIENVFGDPGRDITVVTMFEGIKVMIPASHMGLTPPDENLSKADQTKFYKQAISAMMMATIEYVALDVADGIAVGSRIIAMDIRRKQYCINHFKQTGKTFVDYAIEKGLHVPARVLSTAGAHMRVHVCGVDCRVTAREAAWRYVPDLSQLFAPGEEVKVVIKSAEVSEDGKEAKLSVSIREATPNTQKENIQGYRAGSVCTGYITGVTEKGYYIAIGDNRTGIDAFSAVVHGQRLPQIGEPVVCTLVRVDYDKGYATARITRVLPNARHIR